MNVLFYYIDFFRQNVFISIGEDICKFTLKDLIEMFRFNVVDKLGSNC